MYFSKDYVYIETELFYHINISGNNLLYFWIRRRASNKMDTLTQFEIDVVIRQSRTYVNANDLNMFESITHNMQSLDPLHPPCPSIDSSFSP